MRTWEFSNMVSTLRLFPGHIGHITSLQRTHFPVGMLGWAGISELVFFSPAFRSLPVMEKQRRLFYNCPLSYFDSITSHSCLSVTRHWLHSGCSSILDKGDKAAGPVEYTRRQASRKFTACASCRGPPRAPGLWFGNALSYRILGQAKPDLETGLAGAGVGACRPEASPCLCCGSEEPHICV